MRPHGALGALVLGFACGSPPSPKPGNLAPDPSAPVARKTEGAPSPPAPGPAISAGIPCGELGCQRFDTPRAAFEFALRGAPRVIAVGEAHPQKAAPRVPSAAHRFTGELLPVLAGRVKDLVIELVVPDKTCRGGEEQAVREQTKDVTKPQAETNQSEFVALGFAAKKLSIRPEPLVPTCDELARIVAAGDTEAIGAMLTLIAELTTREVLAFLAHGDPARSVAVYGGLVHNDLAPRPGRETWSFGPALRDQTQGRYVEIDLIVPEYIKKDELWQGLAWSSHYDADRDGEKTVLFQPGPSSYVLIFPLTPDASPGPTPSTP